MSEKETTMVLKLLVDLQCWCCYKKLEKILCKFPQIRGDRECDEKANTVTIRVVCCSPEKIRDKLCCKGSKVIKSIEIKKILKPEAKPERRVRFNIPNQSSNENKPTKKPVKNKPKKTVRFNVPEKSVKNKPDDQETGPVMIPILPQDKEGPKPMTVPAPVGYPPRTCCQQWYEGHGGGPCYHPYPYPYPPRPCYCGRGGYGHGHYYYWYT